MRISSVSIRESLFDLRRIRAHGFAFALASLLAVEVASGQTAPDSTSPRPAPTLAPPVEIPRSSVAPVTAMPPAPAPLSAPNNYQLSANDQIAVEVFGEDDLRTSARLNSDGNVSLPLLGSIRLAGLTLTQATARVTELYARDYLVNPKVSVSLVSYAKRRFTVLGQVNRPGSFEMPDGSPSGIDLLEAIAMAGGYTRIAAPERISVRRHGPKGDEVLKVDAKKMARGAGTSNFKVVPGDTITVGESIF
jgi:protein involved in polysaccharide export with SLBB domain